MSEEILKATVDIIGEADNDIGGILATRLVAAHVWGGLDGLLVNGTNRMTVPRDTFMAGMVGWEVDVLGTIIAGPAGNRGSYKIATVENARSVLLQYLDGASPTFTAETVSWRTASLQVESAFGFPVRDHLLGVWCGMNEASLSYGGTHVAPGDHWFRGVGPQRTSRLGGTVRAAALSRFVVDEPFFAVTDWQAELWVQPLATANGNEGPHRITSIISAYEVEVTPAFAAAEVEVAFSLKTYDADGYLTEDQRENTEVDDASGSIALLDLMRRALCVDHAFDDDLDRCGRNLACSRPRGMRDEIYRRYLFVRAFLPAATLYAFEQVLTALFPHGGWVMDVNHPYPNSDPLGWTIYEDLANYPCQVFLLLPALALSTIYTGRTLLSAEEDLTSDTAVQVTVGETPQTVRAVTLRDVMQDLAIPGLVVLPSADSPAWTFEAEGGTEAIFAVAAGGLQQLQSTVNGGRYQRLSPWMGGLGEPLVQSLSTWFRVVALGATPTDHPWALCIRDGSREYCLKWRNNHMLLGSHMDVAVTSVGLTALGTAWHLVTLVHRRVVLRDAVTEDVIEAWLDGVLVLSALASSFSVSTGRRLLSFGYFNCAANQKWKVLWARVRALSTNTRNYWNLRRRDGQLATSSPLLTSALGLFSPTDTGLRVRLRPTTYASNRGLYLATYVGPTQLSLAGVPVAGAEVEGTSLKTDTPQFVPEDVGRQARLVGAAHNGAGPYTVTAWISSREVTLSGTFTTEDGISFQFEPTFATETGIDWELVGASTAIGKVLTLRDPLPEAASLVRAAYTTIPSGQVLRNELVQNANADPGMYYPFYLLDVDQGTRDILEDVKAAGVRLRYAREH
jgi:hypothetical protein